MGSDQIQKFDPFAMPLPSADDEERFVLATVCQHGTKVPEYMAMLKSEHFNSVRNQEFWDVMRELFEADVQISMETVGAKIVQTRGSLDSVGGAESLLALAEVMPDVEVKHWVKPILEAFARRRLMLKLNEAMIRLSNRVEPAAMICQEVEEEARTCATISEASEGLATFESVVRGAGGMDAFLSNDAGDIVPYPWEGLNHMTNGGMKPGQVIVVAGPSGRGKTALAVNIAYGACRMGRPIMYSLEMDKADIYRRLLALASRVDSFHFRNPDASERHRIGVGSRRLLEEIMFVEDEDCYTVSAMRAMTKKTMSVEPVSMVLIDYAQLIEGKRGTSETREQEISKIMRGLKKMARQLHVPVVVLSQILEDAGAGNREPELKDLRESRSIGHTADLAMFLHFTRAYDMSQGVPTGDMDLIIRKQRNGPTGRVALTFHAPTGRFYELEHTRGSE